MIRLATGSGERVLVDVTGTFRAMTFPVLELILITAISWMIIGYFDHIPAVDEMTAFTIPPESRNLVVLVWLVLCGLRFVLPLIRQRRKRFLVTNHRLIVRDSGISTAAQSFPLHAIAQVGARRNQVVVNVRGYGNLVVNDIPRARRVAEAITRVTAP